MKHKVVLQTISLLAAIATCNISFCQTLTGLVDSGLETMFESMSLNTNRIPTGYLLDRAVELTDIRLLSGTSLTADNYVDATVFRNAIYTLNSSIVNSAGTTYDADAVTNALVDSTAVNLGAALFKYNYIVSNAITDNLIYYSGGKVYDVSVGGVLQNPFSEAKFFAFTPGRPIVSGLSVRYKFSSSHFISNIYPSIIEFDAGDGLGYRGISSTYDNVITYSNEGIKELKMRMTLPGGTKLESHSIIRVLPAPAAVQDAGIVPPSGSFTVRLLNSGSGDIIAKVSYRPAQNHNGNIIKPLIYVEGFDNVVLGLVQSFPDIPAQIDSTSLLNTLSNIYHSSIPLFDRITTKSLGSFDFKWLYNTALPSFISDKYDVFYVDWMNPEADIADNAQLLISAINQINGMKSENSDRNILVGHSMGGLIARYALRQMEQSNTRHETDYYVSLDSPHLGVNVPIGVQYAFTDLSRLLDTSDGSFMGALVYDLFAPVYSYLNCIYNSASAKQMMYYHVTPGSLATGAFHNAWQATLSNLGFPKGDPGYPIENLAISNGGSISGTSNSLGFVYLAAGESSPNLLSLLSIIIPQIIQAEYFDFSLNILRDNGTEGVVSDISCNYTKPFSWTNQKVFHLFGNTENGYHLSHDAPSNSPGYDRVRGSTLLTDDIQYYGDVLSYQYYPPVLFVPEASALAIDDYQNNSSSNPPEPLIDTPFSSYYLHTVAQRHEEHYDSYWSWIDNHSLMSLSGPAAIAKQGDTLSVVNKPSETSAIVWKSLNPSVATINSNGIISIVNVGIAEFECSCDKDTIYYHKHRTLLTGIPSDFHITTSSSGTNYTFTVSCSDSSVNSFLDDAASGGKVTMQWGIKTGSSSIQWYYTSSRTFNATITSSSNIYFRLVDNLGRQHAELHTKVLAVLNVNYDPQIVYTFQGNTYMDYNVIDDDGLAEDYFFVWHRPLSPYSLNPDRLIVNNQTILLDISMSEMVNGVSTTVYCFKILDNSYIQSVISNIDSYPNKTAIVAGMICNGNTFLDNFTITITKGIPLAN